MGYPQPAHHDGRPWRWHLFGTSSDTTIMSLSFYLEVKQHINIQLKNATKTLKTTMRVNLTPDGKSGRRAMPPWQVCLTLRHLGVPVSEETKKSFLFSALYAAFIFGGRHLMNKRAKFELRKPLVLWSLSLAVFSIFGAVRTGAYMLYILMTKGLKQSVCDQSFYIGPVSKFWAYAFVLSKAPELGDTIFIILRKQKLIFLHWYHHITVLLYSWYSYKDMVAGGGWFMTMNYGVHAVMYSYYALRAAGFRVSRKFAMFITLSQITQMLIGCVINYLVFSWMQQGQCHSHVQNIIWSSLMYLSYFVLFCHFFFEAYIGKTRKERKVD
ncbi:PREDICTED: elongation of very long chain fatty acids protein 6-like [Cariama cristata]|uniref:elongation of very long chain fatty acids protein 6-like n=1 Tax=Cariama cristata TaxID=54380 RepID=UPI0005202976|nr:PREDICTED: elongation of very long chain fatty acids protein 6-like [Cariama cristata]